jgi:NTP pyrophosphatase (non-canonical NTP hydrolase)
MKKFYKKFKKNSEKETYSSAMMCLKATEELGELAEIMHWLSGYKKTNKTEKEIKEAIAEEVCDVLNCIMCIAHKEGVDAELMESMMNTKFKKWENNIERLKK